jgi:glycosyltransferase involved in cell wall biosynthesis
LKVVVLSHNRADLDDAYNHRLRALARGLDRVGVNTSVVYLGDPPLARPTLLHALKVNAAAGVSDADVVHAGSAAVAFACAFLRPRRGRRVVFDMHGDTAAEKELALRGALDVAGRLRVAQERAKERVGLAGADRVVVVSRPLRDRLIARGIARARIGIVPNGVDLDRFAGPEPVRARTTPLVVYAGRFDVWQGIRHLEHLAARAGARYCLRVVGFGAGDGAARARLAAAAAGAARPVASRPAPGGPSSVPEPPAVELIDWLSQEKLIPLLADADVLLIPRERHPATEVAMPTKFAEYLALGRPLLVTRVGEPAQRVEAERCGLVADPNPDALVAAVERFASLDAEERLAMGRRARALAEREFSWDTIARAYAAFLDDLLSSPS